MLREEILSHNKYFCSKTVGYSGVDQNFKSPYPPFSKGGTSNVYPVANYGE
jgi:hypothetical protein